MYKLLTGILRFLCGWVDCIVAKLITMIYKLLINLADLVLYSEDLIKALGKRIGLILGIFMLFKLAISLINYMISPDKISDGKQGGGKLIINIGVSLALLVSINFIFKEAYRIQGIVVESKIIEKIFFGSNGIYVSTNDNTATDPNDPNKQKYKMDIGYYLYSNFLTPNVQIFGHACDYLWDVGSTLDEVYEPSPTEQQNESNNNSSDSSTESNIPDTRGKSCNDLLSEVYGKDYENALTSILNARNAMDMSYVLNDWDILITTPQERVYAFEYTPLISNVSGILVLLVLISFSMDLATRAIKLLFLQIIAPIPIISNMDLGKGQEIFKKWGKQCINTYLSVFIRLIAIDFAVFMIVLLRGNYKNVFLNNMWLNVFLIIGALMFAKQVPSLLEEFFGIKLNGLTFHPIKKFQEQAVFGKQITNTATAVGKGGIGTVGGMISGGVAGARVGNTAGGIFAGALMGANMGSRSKTPFVSSMNGVYKNMVGNEFVNFSLTKRIMGSGKKQVQVIKDARNAAYEHLNDYKTKLNTSENVSARLATNLNEQGYDVTDIEKVKRDVGKALNERSAKLRELSDSISRMEVEKNDPNNNLTSEQLAELQRRINNAKAEAQSKQNEFNNLQRDQEAINKYAAALEEQNELRARISAVQKDIDDLSHEKAQRERTYGYDPSPSGDVKKLVQDAKDPSKYRRRIDRNVNH